jgi:hypothetical protein
VVGGPFNPLEPPRVPQSQSGDVLAAALAMAWLDI